MTHIHAQVHQHDTHEGVHSNDCAVLSEAQTLKLLPYPALVDALLSMWEQQRQGLAHAPVRTRLSLPNGGRWLLMPAHNAQHAVLKTVTVHPENPTRGLPTLHCELSFMNAQTGQTLMRCDGHALTARRTAALSLAAAIQLNHPVRTHGKPQGRDTEHSVLVFGHGAQAKAHLHALAELWGVKRFTLCVRHPERARPLLEHLQAHDLQVTCITQHTPVMEQALSQAKLIICATSSHTPLFTDEQARLIRTDALVIAVGAFQPHTAELPPALLKRAQVYVDHWEAARQEAGDLLQAEVDWAQVQELAQAQACSHAPQRPTVVKTVGCALWDLASAELIWRLWQTQEGMHGGTQSTTP